MDKSRFCEELKKKGYDAFIDSGVVMVRKLGKIEDTISEIKALATKSDYNESIGIKSILASKVQTPVLKNDEGDEIEEELPEVETAAEGENVSSQFEQMNFFDMI